MRTALIALLTLPLIAAEIPRKAPEFVIQLPNGGQKLLSEFRGKVVCLEFGFTTCPHCQQSAQVLTQMQKDYGAKGFQTLAVMFNPMAKMLVPEFVQAFKVGFPVGYAEADPIKNFLQVPLNEGMHVPLMVFIDRNGMIRKQSLPRNDAETGAEPNMRKLVEQLLAEKVAPAKAKSGAAPKRKS